MYPTIQECINLVLATGSSCFDEAEQALGESATMVQLSELSANMAALTKRVESLEKENTEVGGDSLGCSKLG
jgi:hypothetical protein